MGPPRPWPRLPAPSSGRDVGWRRLHISHSEEPRQIVSEVLASFLKIHVLLDNFPALAVLFKCHFFLLMSTGLQMGLGGNQGPWEYQNPR